MKSKRLITSIVTAGALASAAQAATISYRIDTTVDLSGQGLSATEAVRVVYSFDDGLLDQSGLSSLGQYEPIKVELTAGGETVSFFDGDGRTYNRLNLQVRNDFTDESGTRDGYSLYADPQTPTPFLSDLSGGLGGDKNLLNSISFTMQSVSDLSATDSTALSTDPIAFLQSADFVSLRLSFGTGGGGVSNGPVTIASVPEPMSMSLLALAGSVLLRRRRR
ncbi:PEP-CTERM sorting domain-containing protein [Sulfuriroseicoccus oceanibius]|uniref:PEP-CTERM sorting domain-containing protein n=1 Tax=Sulfuriroseicoccus oceanibius TaxID=2707525 RepID=A0A6B3L298_9BACT|nr:PEP-CTERM sorting domain-containing protein [Sulfuriroseicoccus oceanibius]QQL44138.1 PEP-CTERM sorting domain-containing protein [Sulfuriroseicoccus oceanibius]